MIINQVDLNCIIELLGDYVYALRFNLKNPIQQKNNGIPFFSDGHKSFLNPNDADPSIQDIQAAKTAYYNELSRLYENGDIPEVFTEQLQVMGNGSNSTYTHDFWGTEAIERDHIEVSIEEIVDTLNKDFNLSEDHEEQTTPLAYTGKRYGFVQDDRISVGVKRHVKGAENMPQTNFYFVMAVLSEPSMLLIAAICAIGSAALFASGAFIPGAIVAAAAVTITSCYAARKLGMFSENDGTKPNVTIEPDSFMSILSSGSL